MENITYDEFIKNILDTRGRFECGDKYHERHHIRPKCMGGTNDEDNLIDLFAQEHFIAHKMLAEENPENTSLGFAWCCMAFMKNGREHRYELTPREYEEAKIALSALNKSRIVSEEQRKRIGEANKGRIVPESARRAVAKANASRVWSEESRRKLSNTISGENHPLYGRHHTEETRKKLSDGHKGLQAGDKNPRALIMLQLDKEDNLIKIWRYVKLASKALKIDASDISRCAKGRLKSAGGYYWKFLYDNKFKDEFIPGAITLGLITEEEALKQLEQDKMIREAEETV